MADRPQHFAAAWFLCAALTRHLANTHAAWLKRPSPSRLPSLFPCPSHSLSLSDRDRTVAALAELRARRCRGRFPLCQPPRSSRAQPSSSPPSPALRAHARLPKPCWKHRSRQSPSPLTAGARGRATSGRLLAINDHQRVRAGTLLLRRPFSAADEPPSAGNSKPGRLLCSKFRPGVSGSNLTKWKGLTA